MGNLRTEHEELKTMFNALKSTNKEPLIIDDIQSKNNAETTMEDEHSYKPKLMSNIELC